MALSGGSQGIAATLMLFSQLRGVLRMGQHSSTGLVGPFVAVLLC